MNQFITKSDINLNFLFEQENIKKRNNSGEANAPLFKDTKFLETMDSIYKKEYLREISAHAELLVYDWTNGGDVELVIEDIEKIGECFESVIYLLMLTFKRLMQNNLINCVLYSKISIGTKEKIQKWQSGVCSIWKPIGMRYA